MTDQQTLASIVDGCIEDVLLGILTVEECLDRWPEHRAELEPLLRSAVAVSLIPVPDVQPNPARRAAFMAELRATPQETPRFRMPSLPVLSLPAFGLGGSMFRFASVAAPAAVVAVIALVLVWSGSSSTASAATLTVFAGSVEQQVDGDWQPVADGATLDEGATIRTLDAALAMLTFPDGSTATVDASTQVALERISLNGERVISLSQSAGRIWNDVVPIQQGDSYVIRTPHAVVAVHGTVFETVVDGDTAVSTAEGLVSLGQDQFRVDVLAGQIVRATTQSISAPEAAPNLGEVRVSGPVSAYLTSPQGAATGVLMNGLVFRQIPGITTTATEEADGSKLQQIVLGDAEPGEYSLVLRRYAPGEGTITVETAAGSFAVTIPENVAIARLPLAVNSTGDGTPALVALNTELESVGEVPPVRVVETERSRQAEMVEAAPQATERPAAVATEASNPAQAPESTRSAAQVQSTQAAAAVAPDSWGGRLQDALTRDNNQRLADVLDEMLEADDDATKATRLALLAAVMSDPASAARIRVHADRGLIEEITTEAARITPGIAEGLRSGFTSPLPATNEQEPAPGNSGDRPGNSGSAPGSSGNSGSEPGNSGNAPGNSGNRPGSSEDRGEAPGNSGNTPGNSGPSSDRDDQRDNDRENDAPRQPRTEESDRRGSRTPDWLQRLLDVLRQGRDNSATDGTVATPEATAPPAASTTSVTPRAALSPTAAPSPSPTPTAARAAAPSATATPSATAAPSPTAVPRVTSTPAPTPTPTPALTPTPTAPPTPTTSATATPAPSTTSAPSPDPTEAPAETPIPEPTPDYPWWWPWWWR